MQKEVDNAFCAVRPPGHHAERNRALGFCFFDNVANRASLGLGVKRGDLFQEAAWRPAYHDLLDSDRGYREGAQIIFSSVALRYYPLQGSLQLDNFDFIDIVSLTPRDEFFQPISWKVKTGFERRILADDDDHLIYRLNPGGGFAWQNDLLGLYYVMTEADLNVSRPMEENYALGIGGSAGFIKLLTDSWKPHVFVRDIYYGLGDTSPWRICFSSSCLTIFPTGFIRGTAFLISISLHR